MKPSSPRVLIAVIIGALTLGLAAPALAQADTARTDTAPETEDVTRPGLKARCQEAIDQRLDHLAAAQARVNRVDTLSDAHEATIDDIIDRTQSGLTRLSNQIEASTERSVTVGLCAQIAPDFRVYLVVLPQIHLTVAADRSQVATEIGYNVLDKLDEAIARAEEAGADVTEAQRLRDEAQGYLDAADTASDGVAASVLGVTPDIYNNADGAAVLDTARTHMRTTQKALEEANAAGRAAGKALRAALGAIA
jgi:hypothetical protein